MQPQLKIQPTCEYLGCNEKAVTVMCYQMGFVIVEYFCCKTHANRKSVAEIVKNALSNSPSPSSLSSPSSSNLEFKHLVYTLGCRLELEAKDGRYEVHCQCEEKFFINTTDEREIRERLERHVEAYHKETHNNPGSEDFSRILGSPQPIHTFGKCRVCGHETNQIYGVNSSGLSIYLCSGECAEKYVQARRGGQV